MKSTIIVQVTLILFLGLCQGKILSQPQPPPPQNLTLSDERLFYQECKRNSDCPENYCCVIGMMRYQVPYCLPLGSKDDPCHPYQQDNLRRDYTLHFPNNRLVHVEESWILMCPCDKTQGFYCSKSNATCIHI